MRPKAHWASEIPAARLKGWKTTEEWVGGSGRATALWRAAYRYQMEGELDAAIEHYQRSVEVYPTAEAHTFLGWSLSAQGRLEEATAECLRAIEIDPDFGNPYNDIGVYLMQQGRLDEAILWLEQAKQARRYGPRQFPFLNLGRRLSQAGALVGRAARVRGRRAGGSGRRACREDAASPARAAELR